LPNGKMAAQKIDKGILNDKIAGIIEILNVFDAL
jgi:hypothetical protein